MKTLIAFTALLLLTGSCTIQKRLHQPGWHVEWKRNHRNAEPATDVAQRDSIAASDSLVAAVKKTPTVVKSPGENKPATSTEKAETTAPKKEAIAANERRPQLLTDAPTAEPATVEEMPDSISNPQAEEETPNYPLRRDVIAVLALIAGIVAGAEILNFLLQFFFLSAVTADVWLAGVFALVFLVAFIVLATMAAIRKKRNPDKYKPLFTKKDPDRLRRDPAVAGIWVLTGINLALGFAVVATSLAAIVGSGIVFAVPLLLFILLAISSILTFLLISTVKKRADPTLFKPTSMKAPIFFNIVPYGLIVTAAIALLLLIGLIFLFGI